MKVGIKEFHVAMDVKSKGMELEVYENGDDGAFLGDLIISKKGLIWCKGRTTRKHGVPVEWKEFIKWMESE